MVFTIYNQDQVLFTGEFANSNVESHIELDSPLDQCVTVTPINGAKIDKEREILGNNFNGIFNSNSQWFEVFVSNVLNLVLLDNPSNAPD